MAEIAKKQKKSFFRHCAAVQYAWVQLVSFHTRKLNHRRISIEFPSFLQWKFRYQSKKNTREKFYRKGPNNNLLKQVHWGIVQNCSTTRWGHSYVYDSDRSYRSPSRPETPSYNKLLHTEPGFSITGYLPTHYQISLICSNFLDVHESLIHQMTSCWYTMEWLRMYIFP